MHQGLRGRGRSAGEEEGGSGGAALLVAVLEQPEEHGADREVGAQQLRHHHPREPGVGQERAARLRVPSQAVEGERKLAEDHLVVGTEPDVPYKGVDARAGREEGERGIHAGQRGKLVGYLQGQAPRIGFAAEEGGEEGWVGLIRVPLHHRLHVLQPNQSRKHPIVELAFVDNVPVATLSRGEEGVEDIEAAGLGPGLEGLVAVAKVDQELQHPLNLGPVGGSQTRRTSGAPDGRLDQVT
mmetsp:Transcript_73949/g.197103  ORF Transcript_73949/g.197103 Transcript_73949/m.197103 type:complete len:240 (+) Transcript_73949:402-1121(+)